MISKQTAVGRTLRRVVVTGLGGHPGRRRGQGLLGRHLRRPVRVGLTLVDPEPVPSKVAAECLDFDSTTSLGPKEARRLDRATQLALTAAREAWRTAASRVGSTRTRPGWCSPPASAASARCWPATR